MVSKSLFLKLLLIAVAGGILIGYFLVHQFSLPAEAALRLTEGGLIAEGSTPYVDFLDNVTPFYLYLNVLPAQLSRLFLWHPITVLNILNTLLVMLAGTCLALLSEVKSRRNPLNGSIWPILIAFLLITALQPVHFAEANQIFFLLLCPYIACRACSSRALPVPKELAAVIGAALCIPLVMDPYYWLFFFLFELCLLVNFFPFPDQNFVARRYLAAELKVVVYVFAIVIVSWLLVPCESTTQYLNIITKLNDYSFNMPLLPLCFFDTCTDTRSLIYLACLLLMIALPQARQSVLVRCFAVAALLGFGLMVIQGATLAFQAYLLVGFAIMAMATSLNRQPLLRRVFPAGGAVLDAAMGKFAIKPRFYLAATLLVCALTVAGTYMIGLSHLSAQDRYDLKELGYHGVADRRDLTILSEVVEQFSKPGQPVAILSLGVRPAYPLLTQLRRKPALSLTWGFTIDPLNVLKEPMYGKEANPLRTFRNDMYAKMRRELATRYGPAGAPVLVLIDEDETKRTLEDVGINKILNEYYTMQGMASLKASDSKDGHPPLEYVGYRAALDIYRSK
jgi:hypothetical protein